MGVPSRLLRSTPWRPPRHWRLLPLALMGLSGPGALGQTLGAIGVNTPGVNDADCRTMALPMVYGLTLAVALGGVLGLVLVKRRLTREGWSLANALSEPTRLSIPLEWRWTDSAGDQLSIGRGEAASSKVLRGPDGTPMAVTMLEASSSRMIATIGGISILMLYMGFGIFALYSFGLTCQLPPSMGAVSTFLLSGLSLFAPYVANKVSTAIQPNVRSASQEAPPAPAATPATPATPVSDDRAEAILATALASGPSTPQAPVAPPSPTRLEATLPVLSSTPPQRQATPSAPTEAPKPAPPPAPSSTESSGYGPALALIREFEGFVDHAYPDPASGAEPWTIGYGFTEIQGRPVQPGQTISRANADAELQRQVEACANHLASTIPYWDRMNTNQRCALVDFAWNLGADFYGDQANFATISRDLQTHDWPQVPRSFLLYCDPGTPVEAGLLRRRQAEASLWQRPVEASPIEPAPAPAPAKPAPSTSEVAPPASRFSNPLKVPYCDQLLMADGQGWRECFSASSAMLAMYWGKEPNENVYDSLRARYGDSTSSEAQLDALRSLGLQANFLTDGTVQMLKEQIDAGRPVAVGWLCDGPFTAPSGGGHWMVIVGYDADGLFVNDPYGNCDLVNGGYISHHDGASLHYSYAHWVPRWQVGGSGGWMLTCRP